MSKLLGNLHKKKPLLTSEQDQAVESLIQMAFSRLDKGALERSQKKATAKFIRSHFEIAEPSTGFAERLKHFEDVLGLIDKAAQIGRLAINEYSKKEIKKEFKKSAAQYGGRILNLNRHIDDIIRDSQYICPTRPWLLTDLVERGLSGFTDRLPAVFEESLKLEVFNPALVNSSVDKLRRDIDKFNQRNDKSDLKISGHQKRPSAKPVAASPANNNMKVQNEENLQAKLEHEVEVLYRSIQTEIGGIEIETADLPSRIKASLSELVIEQKRADSEKVLHLKTKRKLQDKVNSLTIENPELFSNDLIKRAIDALQQSTKILRSGLSLPSHDISSAFVSALEKLRKSVSPMERLGKCEEALKILLEKEKKRAELVVESLTLGSEVTHQQRRFERYAARRKFFNAITAEVDGLLAGRGIDVPNVEKSYPPLSLFREWYEANPELQGRVIIAESAIKETENSGYTKPDLVYEAVSLLGHEFWLQKNSASLDEAGRKAARAQFKHKMKNLGLKVGGSITTSHNKFEGVYSATVNGERLFMDMHLQKGNSFDSRYCLRIYFAWSDRQNAVLIGHMPSHLRNEIS